MGDLLPALWWRLAGTLQWHIIWMLHSKFMVGVTGVVLDDRRRVLLLRHRFWPAGSWGLPGGYARKRERLEDTLRREVREETGYVIQPAALLQVVSGYKLRVEVSYLARFLGGDLALDPREVLEARFFPLDSLPDGVLASQRRLIERIAADAS